jgi:hypothetical protein
MPGTPAGDVPPVPVHLSGCPTEGGLVVPYISLRHADGKAALGLVDAGRIATCLRERRCGVCGQVMPDRMVFLMRQRDLDRNCSSEPGRARRAPEPARYGAPAEPWFRLWTRAYRIVRPPEGGIAAGFDGVRVLAVRPVPQPGAEQER